MEEWELEQAKEDAKQLKEQYERLHRGQMLLQQEALNSAAKNAIDDGIMEACKAAGITPEQFGAMFHSNPQKSIEIQRRQAKRYAEKVIKKSGVVRDPKTGQWVKADPKQQSQQARPGSMAEVREAQRSGSLSSDEALDRMVQGVLGDYFSNL